jgi:hypothetical protein
MGEKRSSPHRKISEEIDQGFEPHSTITAVLQGD